MMYLLLLVGFLLLLKGADFFVDGSSSIAGILRVPSIVIGLTIVAMGTSAPETAVDLWWNIAVSAGLVILLLDFKLSRLECIILLIGMTAYLFVVIRGALRERTDAEPIRTLSVPRSILYIVGGLIAIICGGNLVVDNASLIARSLGMSDTLVGLTIVAIGTSLPELMTSIVAAQKGDSGIALGNAVGSCLFNIMFILGATSSLTPIHAAPELLIDSILLTAVCILILVLARSHKITSRKEGIICILCYLAYSVYIILR